MVYFLCPSIKRSLLTVYMHFTGCTWYINIKQALKLQLWQKLCAHLAEIGCCDIEKYRILISKNRIWWFDAGTPAYSNVYFDIRYSSMLSHHTMYCLFKIIRGWGAALILSARMSTYILIFVTIVSQNNKNITTTYHEMN